MWFQRLYVMVNSVRQLDWPRVSGLNIISGRVQMRLAFGSVDPGWVGTIQPIEGLNWTKGRRRNLPLFPASQQELGHLISSSAPRLGFTPLAPWLSGLCAGFPGSPAHRRQTRGRSASVTAPATSSWDIPTDQLISKQMNNLLRRTLTNTEAVSYTYPCIYSK